MGWAVLYDQPLLSYGSFSRISSAVFWIKRKHKYKILNNFLLTIKFSQSLESTINTVQNFGYVQNKNSNLGTR